MDWTIWILLQSSSSARTHVYRVEVSKTKNCFINTHTLTHSLCTCTWCSISWISNLGLFKRTFISLECLFSCTVSVPIKPMVALLLLLLDFGFQLVLCMLRSISNFSIAIMYILMDHVFMFISFTSDEIVWLVLLSVCVYTHPNLSVHPRESVTVVISLGKHFETTNAPNATHTHTHTNARIACSVKRFTLWSQLVSFRYTLTYMELVR